MKMMPLWMMSSHRVGLGCDSHRLQKELPLIIGGVKIESPMGFVAHSDGDVLLHALIDALLGALALGDIGDHFNPSNPIYKNANSEHLLKQVLQLPSFKNWQVVNVDATLHLEQPKLYPYKKAIRENIAHLLNIEVERVSVKAKTAEGLDAIGQGLAASCQCVILLENCLVS